jgi:hypothetical protein
MFNRTRSTVHWMLAAILAVAVATGCGSCDQDPSGNNSNSNSQQNGDTNNGDLDAGNNITDADNGGDGGATGDGGESGDATTGDTGPQQDANSPFTVDDAGMVQCGDGPCACDDGMDNDGDGLIDGFDPECTGPYDDDEGTFATGIPGDNKDPIWQDCFFDGNSGSGDDKCRYKTGCLTGDLDPSHRDCQVSQQCLEFCRPLTPNGCDCFGCCEVFDADGDSHFVVIGGECSVDGLGTDACQTCTQTTECTNDCGRCELCLGKTIDDLPDDCFDDPNDPDMSSSGDGGGSGGPTCEDGLTPCQSSTECASNEYCQLGCCIEVIL